LSFEEPDWICTNVNPEFNKLRNLKLCDVFLEVMSYNIKLNISSVEATMTYSTSQVIFKPQEFKNDSNETKNKQVSLLTRDDTINICQRTVDIIHANFA